MAHYLRLPDDKGSSAANNWLLQVTGISGVLSNVEFKLALPTVAYIRRRYYYDGARTPDSNASSSLNSNLSQQFSGSYGLTTISNLRINGAPAVNTAAMFNNRIADDVLSFDCSVAPTDGCAAFFAQANATNAMYSLGIYYLQITDNNGVHKFNMSSSNGVANQFTSDTGLLTLKLFNFPLDNSHWVFYDDGTEEDIRYSTITSSLGIVNSTNSSKLVSTTTNLDINTGSDIKISKTVTVSQSLAQTLWISKNTYKKSGSAVLTELLQDYRYTTSKKVENPILSYYSINSSTQNSKVVNSNIQLPLNLAFKTGSPPNNRESTISTIMSLGSSIEHKKLVNSENKTDIKIGVGFVHQKTTSSLIDSQLFSLFNTERSKQVTSALNTSVGSILSETYTSKSIRIDFGSYLGLEYQTQNSKTVTTERPVEINIFNSVIHNKKSQHNIRSGIGSIVLFYNYYNLDNLNPVVQFVLESDTYTEYIKDYNQSYYVINSSTGNIND